MTSRLRFGQWTYDARAGSCTGPTGAFACPKAFDLLGTLLESLPLFATPAFPEYPSGHSTVSSAAAAVLARFFGQRTPFRMDSDLMLGVVRDFRSLPDALE